MTNYARIENRTAYLSTDFGEEIARKWFGNESVDSLPRYTRGARKGKVKGVVTWSKVVRGGWVSTSRETANGSASGYVENRVGHVFERKLHNIVSNRFGTSVGDVIRDLEKEEAAAKYQNYIRSRIDEEMRVIEMKRSLIELAILSEKVDENGVKILQGIIIEFNEDISSLCEQLK